MTCRELTPVELEQRKKLDERFKGRKLPPIDWNDVGIPVCACEECANRKGELDETED